MNYKQRLEEIAQTVFKLRSQAQDLENQLKMVNNQILRLDGAYEELNRVSKEFSEPKEVKDGI